MMTKKHTELKGIIDVHCHVIPGVDDGSESVEESLKMLKIAADEGITHMLCTSHYKADRHNASVDTLKQRRLSLQKEASRSGLNITLLPGNEILYFGEMFERIENGTVNTFNNTKYIMVEFHPADRFQYIRNALENVQEHGYIPVVAHVERYACIIREPDLAIELSRMGIKLQVNASSVLGETGRDIKKCAVYLLEEGAVSYIGTDAHSSRKRAPRMKKCVKYLYKILEEDYVEDILYNNAKIDFEIT
ncbi:MAG: protein-tyrosine-phosphatase [Clostridiales bacterium]|nr:protein-tyrosine-phosphatase [Clostridiales bacterium]